VSYDVVFTVGAQSDLDDIERYLAMRFSERNAERYVGRIVAFCRSLGLAPYRGTALDALRPSLRSVGMERRVRIVFQVKEAQVVILGVSYAGRLIDFERLG
jgi:plasmid stabilization system protein ParE